MPEPQNTDIFARIQAVIERSSSGAEIAEGRHLAACRVFSKNIYRALQDPANRIEGLSVAVVNNLLPSPDHAWLIAHHPSVGYFMIDPSIGQMCEGRNGRLLKEAFIGTHEELYQRIQSGEYRPRLPVSYMAYVWSPAVSYQPETTGGKFLVRLEDEETIWAHCPYPRAIFKNTNQTPLDKPSLANAEIYGIWAARMVDAGIANWLQALKDCGTCAPSWPQTDDEKTCYHMIKQCYEQHRSFEPLPNKTIMRMVTTLPQQGLH